MVLSPGGWWQLGSSPSVSTALRLVADRTGELGGDDGERLEAFGARRDEEEPAREEAALIARSLRGRAPG